MPLPILTDRLVLRPPEAGDDGDVLAIFGSPEVMRFWNSPPLADLAEAAEAVVHLAEMQSRLGYTQWHVSERDGGRLAGFAGLQPLDDGPEVELSFALTPALWGRGLATEAGAAILAFGFAEAGLDEIVTITRPGNAAMRRVLRKLGMRGVVPAEYFGSSWVKFVLTAGEWRAALAGGALPL
jgi:RimJ/RimL family protein N-acetyltransferase